MSAGFHPGDGGPPRFSKRDTAIAGFLLAIITVGYGYVTYWSSVWL